jgi:hypothetical protein
VVKDRDFMDVERVFDGLFMGPIILLQRKTLQGKTLAELL